jgi:Fungal chitosanase of glycosyl hydrolase group 75
MDVDCDGADNTAGKCGNDPSGQRQTAFKGEAAGYGITDLNANVHSYIVFGNEGKNPNWLPSSAGVKSLSVMAVVCGGKMV